MTQLKNVKKLNLLLVLQLILYCFYITVHVPSESMDVAVLENIGIASVFLLF